MTALGNRQTKHVTASNTRHQVHLQTVTVGRSFLTRSQTAADVLCDSVLSSSITAINSKTTVQVNTAFTKFETTQQVSTALTKFETTLQVNTALTKFETTLQVNTALMKFETTLQVSVLIRVLVLWDGAVKMIQ